MRKLFVSAAPTVIYFNGGQELERVEGFRGKLYHQEFIDNELLMPAGGASSNAVKMA